MHSVHWDAYLKIADECPTKRECLAAETAPPCMKLWRSPKTGMMRKRLSTVIMMEPQPTRRVPSPGPFWSTAPRMNEMRYTKAPEMVSSAVMTKPSGALLAGIMRFLKKGTQPTTSPDSDATVRGGMTLFAQPSSVWHILHALLSRNRLQLTTLSLAFPFLNAALSAANRVVLCLGWNSLQAHVLQRLPQMYARSHHKV